jgi:hypothetical protein
MCWGMSQNLKSPRAGDTVRVLGNEPSNKIEDAMNEELLNKLRQIKAMLAAITGSAGAEEMGDDLGPYLDACHELAAAAVAMSHEETAA